MIALGGLAVALGVGAVTWRLLPREGPPASSSIGMDTPLGATEVSVGVEEMIRDYLGDQRAADAKYLDKTVAVTGVLLEVDRREPQMVTLVISRQLGSKESPCACQGRPALEQAAAQLSPGQRVTVRGKMVGMQQMQMVLLNCEIAPAAVDLGGTSSSR